MENFDSKDEEQISKSIAGKLQQIRQHFNNMPEEEHKQMMETLVQKVNQAKKGLDEIRELAKYEGLSEEEEKFLKQSLNDLEEIILKFDEVNLLLGNSIWIQTVGYMTALKEAADKGDVKAKQIYAELYPIYKKALESNFENLSSNN